MTHAADMKSQRAAYQTQRTVSRETAGLTLDGNRRRLRRPEPVESDAQRRRRERAERVAALVAAARGAG